MTEGIEVWRPIAGYEGKYEVSNWGRVRSLDYHRTGETRILKPCKDNYGYLRVRLCKNGKMITKKVHRIVAEAFLPNPLNLPQVNHKKEDDKTFNFIFLDENGSVVPEKSSLEWCDAKYNSNFGTRNERHAKTMKGKFVNRPDQSKRTLQYDLEGNLVKEWLSTHEVKRQLGWSRGGISNCCVGKQKTAHGFVWRHANNQGE